jgi:MFS family permease
MISEVTPRGKEFLFFALFSIMGKTSAFIGPIVSSAIIDASPNGNNSLPFYFLLGLSILSFCLLAFFVDLKKSRIEQELFLQEERAAKERRASVISMKNGVEVGSGSDSADGKDAEKEGAPEITGGEKKKWTAPEFPPSAKKGHVDVRRTMETMTS